MWWWILFGVAIGAIIGLAWVFIDPRKKAIVHMHDEGEPCNPACGPRR